MRKDVDRFWIDAPAAMTPHRTDVETRESADDELRTLLAKIDALESRLRTQDEVVHKQTILLEYLEPKNEALSRENAELLVENTRLRVELARDAA